MRLGGWLSARKAVEAKVDQPKDAVTTTSRTAKLTVPEPPTRTIRHTAMAAVRGMMQYPNTHRLWKKEMVPPSSLELRVMMMEPNQTMTKTWTEKQRTDLMLYVIYKIY